MCRQATIAASQPDVGRRAGWDQQVAISYGSSGGARRESATPAPARIQRRERRGDIVLLEGWQGATPAFPPHCRREKNMRHIGKSQSKLPRGRTDRERNGRPTRAPGRWARPRSAPSPAAARDRPCASSCAPAGDRHTYTQHIRSTIAALPGHPAHHASQHFCALSLCARCTCDLRRRGWRPPLISCTHGCTPAAQLAGERHSVSSSSAGGSSTAPPPAPQPDDAS
jgi:hypothetical protein